MFRIGLASVPITSNREEAIAQVDSALEQAARDAVRLVCFPETYVPGYRGLDFPVVEHNQQAQEQALEEIRDSCKRFSVGAIVGFEWETALGLHTAAMVIAPSGELLGYQAKNQMDPSEDGRFVPDGKRTVFEMDGLKFGIAICHEGWRYPETVRWAARRGAQIVFHPHFTGSDLQGNQLQEWGDPNGPYFEKAMVSRSIENTIYFASVNCAMKYQDSATSLIAPDGNLAAFQPYGSAGLLVCDLDLARATGLLATRYRPELYP